MCLPISLPTGQRDLLSDYNGCVLILTVVGLYSESDKGPIMLSGTDSGVTHMLFSPDGNLLYTGLRKVRVLWLL